jgi:hypothetical protein
MMAAGRIPGRLTVPSQSKQAPQAVNDRRSPIDPASIDRGCSFVTNGFDPFSGHPRAAVRLPVGKSSKFQQNRQRIVGNCFPGRGAYLGEGASTAGETPKCL